MFNGQFQVDLNASLQTGMVAGSYCDISSGKKVGNSCTGRTIVVAANGVANIFLSSAVPQGFIAIHEGSKL